MALCNLHINLGLPTSELLLCLWRYKSLFRLCHYFEFLLLNAKLILTALTGPCCGLRIQMEAPNHFEAPFLQVNTRLRQKYRKGDACLEILSSTSKWHSDATILSSLLRSPGLHARCIQPVFKGPHKTWCTLRYKIIRHLFPFFLGIYVLLETKLSDKMFGIIERPVGETFLGKEGHTWGCHPPPRLTII